MTRRNKGVDFSHFKPTPRTWEDHGVRRRVDALELSLRSMLEGYDRLVQVMPEGSTARRLAQGSFMQAPEVARLILEAS